jgi:DNA-directed RNA polymerase, mitochondrial
LDYQRTEARHAKNVERLVVNFGYARAPEGEAIIRRHIEPLIEFIAKVRQECPPARKRPQPSLTPELWRLMDGVPNDLMAWVVFRGVLNAIWTRKPDDSEALKARLAIGREIWRECRGVALARKNRPLAAKIAKAAWRRGSTQAREREERKLLRKHGIGFRHWDPLQLAHAGNWGYDCCRQALPGVFPETEDRVPAIDAGAVDDASALAMLAHPIFSPSLKPPTPWTDFEDAHGTPLVRNARNEKAIRLEMVSGRMKQCVDGVNYAQSVAWAINEPVLDFVKALAKRPDGCKLLKKVKHKGGWTVFGIDMAMAASLVGRPFWVRQNIDTRGRMYPLPHFSYQRADHIRGLFKFANGERIGEDGIRWLKIAVANAFNDDKRIGRSLFPERIAWTEDNLDAIRDVALNPMGRLKWLGMASDSIQFVALAIELTSALAEGPDYIATVPIGFDASCSGAQHLSLLARDISGASLTNLVPGDCVECIYDAVRKRVAVQIACDDVVALKASAAGKWFGRHAFDFPAGRHASWWNRGEVDRPLLKMLVMTYFYGSQEGGLRLNIYEELFDRNFIKENIPKDAVTYLIKAVEKAVNAELKAGAPVVMNYLRFIAVVLGNRAAEWTSPSGLPVLNLYQRALTQTPRFWLGDKVHRYVTAYDYGEFDGDKAENAIAPNLVHTLDAAHLSAVQNVAGNEGIALATVHDSYAALPSRATRVREILLEEMRRLYAKSDPLAQIRENAARRTNKKLPPIPPRGELQLEQVTGPYAFA